jgi:hypothetical protein
MKVPKWLSAGARITSVEKQRLLKINRNWLTIFAARNNLTEEDCLKLIFLEIKGKCRLDVLHKVKVWYDKRRSSRENKELTYVLVGKEA